MKTNNLLHSVLIAFISLLVCASTQLEGQAIETEFGKNRVQYHDDFKYWSKYETRNFITYWYGRGRNIGQVAAQMAELDHNDIRKIIEHKINDKIEIIVYVDVNDLKQSNLGAEDAFVSKSGETKIVGNKMFVYFDGNHHHLRKKIREGIASVYFSAMMFGANFQEIIQNAVLLEVPEWFAEGIISYAGNTWNIFIEDELRDILYRDEKYSDFKKLSEDHPRVAGHALWYYISRNYGNSAISNLLYLTRISRDIENAFEFVLNTPLSQVYKECEKFYFQKYEIEDGVFNLLKSKNKLPLTNKSYAPVSQLAVSPTGEFLAYAHNNQGKLKIRLYNFKTSKETKVFRQGFKNSFQETDYNYPNITWNSSGTEFTFTYLSRDEIFLCRYNLESGEIEEQLLPNVFQRVYALDYFDERYYVLSASTQGLSDLFLYDSKMRQHYNITNDFYDDLDVVVDTFKGEKGIYFASNRTNDHILPEDLDTILPVANFDLFFYPLNEFTDKDNLENSSKLLERITSTPTENERYPQILGEKKDIVYMNDKHGIINSFLFKEEANQSIPINNHGRNLIRHSASKNGKTYVFTLYNNGAYEVYKASKDFKKVSQVYTTELKRKLSNNNSIDVEQIERNKDEYDPGMKFVSEFPDSENMEEIQDENNQKYLPFLSYPSITIEDQKEASIIKFNSAKVLAAGLRFKLANLTTRLDNEVLFEGLELYDGQNPQVNQIPMGILAKATVDDLFEDYTFEGGVRFPTTFNGSEYFIFFDNKKKLLDKRFGLYRRALTEGVNSDAVPFTKSKKEAIIGMYQLKYPFNIYSSIRATASLRFDRYYFKSTNDLTLNYPINRDKRVGVKLEYIFDNSLDYRLNIKHGSRAKIYFETFNQFELDVIDGLDFEASKGLTAVIGYDARHYIPLLKECVIALRSTGATSFGSKKNVYLLGDVNNTIIPSFNNSIPIPGDQNFAFKANVNHLRGFNSNVRNGSTFVLWNAELRIPVFRYFMEKDKGSSFFRDFHFVGFADAGLAWYGANPYSDKNPLNTVTVSDPISQIEVTYFRDPLVAGYGLGIRTTVLGYFIRVDYAWGVETREIQDPRWHFSFGYDF